MVKIALTIGKGKKKRKPAVSPQWHAVPDPSARSFLKILMRRPSHPANGLATNRSTVRWAAAWRAGRHQQGPGPHLRGGGVPGSPSWSWPPYCPRPPRKGWQPCRANQPPSTQQGCLLGRGQGLSGTLPLCSVLGWAVPAPPPAVNHIQWGNRGLLLGRPQHKKRRQGLPWLLLAFQEAGPNHAHWCPVLWASPDLARPS